MIKKDLVSYNPLDRFFDIREDFDSLIGRKAGDGRHDSACVAGQHNDVPGMAAESVRHRAVEMRNRVGGAGILGQRIVVEVDLPGLGVKRDIFQDGPETTRAGIDLWLAFRRQPNDLGIASALEIEDAVITPPVFIIADQSPRRIC